MLTNTQVCIHCGCMNTTQQRARVGGELGANGEWYEGGKFIATQEHTVKESPIRFSISPEEEARRAANKAEDASNQVRLKAWIDARAEQFKSVLEVLEAGLNDQWGRQIEVPETFHQSLGRQLRCNGSASEKQASHIAKAVFGRQNRRNSDEYEELLDELVKKFDPSV